MVEDGSTPGPVAVLVLAAGRGERLGHALPKAFVPLAGVALVERSIRALAAAGVFDVIQPVVATRDLERWAQLRLDGTPGLQAPVPGGAERQDSMREGLAALPADVAFVAVHDAARCLVAAEDLRAVVEAARESGAALLGERSRDTLKRVRDGCVVETPPRDEMWAAQTPQVIRRDWIERAMSKAVETGRLGTDDAQLVEWAGHPVAMVEASAPNPKITRPEDLRMAEAMLTDEEAG